MAQKKLRIGMLSTIAWRTPPRKYGPWEQVASLITEGLVKRGLDVTLFATKDSFTSAKLHAVCPRGYHEDTEINPDVWGRLHVSEIFEHADEFDIIHNQFDYPPLSYSRLVKTPVVTTIHGFSSPKIVPVYEKYDANTYYVSISNANRLPSLHYIATVHHGLDISQFAYSPQSEGYLLFFGRVDQEKGAREAIMVAQKTGKKLIMAGLISNPEYFKREVEPHINNTTITYIGNVGPEERSKVLGGADALLHLINFDEPFGLSPVEAMACGTPVIAMNRGSMPEIIADNKTGFLVTSVDEAITAVQRLATLNRADCRQWIEDHFHVDVMVDNYIKVYEAILSGTYQPGVTYPPLTGNAA